MYNRVGARLRLGLLVDVYLILVAETPVIVAAQLLHVVLEQICRDWPGSKHNGWFTLAGGWEQTGERVCTGRRHGYTYL